MDTEFMEDELRNTKGAMSKYEMFKAECRKFEPSDDLEKDTAHYLEEINDLNEIDSAITSTILSKFDADDTFAWQNYRAIILMSVEERNVVVESLSKVNTELRLVTLPSRYKPQTTHRITATLYVRELEKLTDQRFEKLKSKLDMYLPDLDHSRFSRMKHPEGKCPADIFDGYDAYGEAEEDDYFKNDYKIEDNDEMGFDEDFPVDDQPADLNQKGLHDEL